MQLKELNKIKDKQILKKQKLLYKFKIVLIKILFNNMIFFIEIIQLKINLYKNILL